MCECEIRPLRNRCESLSTRSVSGFVLKNYYIFNLLQEKIKINMSHELQLSMLACAYAYVAPSHASIVSYNLCNMSIMLQHNVNYHVIVVVLYSAYIHC